MVKLRYQGLEYDVLDRNQVTLLILPTLACILLYIAPIQGKNQLQFSFENPNPLYMYTQAFIHGDLSHLAGNLVSYTFLILTNIILFTVTGKARLLNTYSVIIFLILPIVHALAWNIITYTLLGGYLGVIGLSSIVSAYAGLLIGYSTQAYEVTNITYDKPKLFLATITLTADIIMISYFNPNPLYILAILLVFALFLHCIKEPFASILRHYRAGKSPEIIIITASLIVGLAFISAAFPSNPLSEGQVTNILTHYVGLVFGVLLPLSYSLIFDKKA